MPTNREIILCGPKGAGKTSLMNRHCKGTFSETTATTVGLDHDIVSIFTPQKNRTIPMKICDMSGDKLFRVMLKQQFANASAAAIVVDLANESLEANLKIINEMLAHIKKSDTDRLYPIAIVGAKCDRMLVAESMLAAYDMHVAQLESTHPIIGFYASSAKENINVQEIFKALGEHLLLSDSESEDSLENIAKDPVIDVEPKPSAFSKFCNFFTACCGSKKYETVGSDLGDVPLATDLDKETDYFDLQSTNPFEMR